MLLYTPFLFIFAIIPIILYCDGAPSNKLHEIKNDISKLGTTIEDFAFHIVQDIVEDVAPIDDYEPFGNADNTTETVPPESTTDGKREKRATMSESECLQRCKPKDHIAEEHIEDLKTEVQKLQELIEIMNEQQDIAKSIDFSEKAATFKQPSEELIQIKIDLKHAVKGLNDTKQILNAQRKKSEMLERELMSQKLELEKLRFAFINRSDDLVGDANIVGASPDFPELSKLLKSISDDEGDLASDSDEVQTRIKELELQLQKKKRRHSLSKKIKALEDKLKVSEKEDEGLLIRLEKLIKNEAPQGRDGDINNLDDLKSAIEKLRPKEESRQQPPERQQGFFQQKQLSSFPQGSNSIPYMCLVENNGPNNFNFRKFYGPAIGGSNVKFVTPEASDQSYGGSPANSYGANQEKPTSYQPQAVVPQVYQTDSSITYKEDLRKQIEALQNAINNLNRPEYIRKPEDKAIISNLEYQVSDLRNILNNQAQGSGSYQYPEQQYRSSSSRIKRDIDEDEEMIDKMTEFLGKILHEDVRSHPDQNELNDLQERIDEIKKQLDGSTDSKLRSTGVDLLHQPYQPQPKNHLLVKKQDFFSDFLGKIIDKIIASIPVVVSKLFNFSFEELSANYGYDNDGYEMQNIFKNLGVFGYLPVILLRLISGFGSIVKVLKKSEFFRKFLLPVLVLLTVSGAVLFLIWWLQPDDDLNNNNYIAYDNGYNNYTTTRPVSVNYPVYNRSYYNK